MPSLARFLPDSNSHSRVLPATEQLTPRTVMAALQADLAQMGQVAEIDAASSGQGDDAAGTLLARLDSEAWTRGARRARAKALKEGREPQTPPATAEPLFCLRCSAQWAEARREPKSSEDTSATNPGQDAVMQAPPHETAPSAPEDGATGMPGESAQASSAPAPRPVRVVVEWTFGREKQRAAFAACAESLLRRLEASHKA